MAVKKDNSDCDHKYLFHRGNDSKAYEFLGAHFENAPEGAAVFRVWAPHAAGVSVVGDFNGWNSEKDPMEKITDGIWEASVFHVNPFDHYKYSIKTQDSRVLLKSDPYAFYGEHEPGHASQVYELGGYSWNDGAYIAYRDKGPLFERPLNIYEVHAGSFMRGEGGAFLSYEALSENLIPYVKEMGYTHIEFMPLTEHPYDGSWGYQCTGYFAATSRYGQPKDLMKLIDDCHQCGVGVILDWVPAHFPKDDFALYEFDGECLYEYSDPQKREHPDWGTRVFDFGKNEVRSFLVSSASFWFDKYHVDGLRVDAVASMLYLDYGRASGEWQRNANGGRENLEAVEFLRLLNTSVFSHHPSALMIAEESTAWPQVTKPPYMGGLGFNYKWNMGWMNDTLDYMSAEPEDRRHLHRKITFSFMYAFSENFILPLSHDEAVHGKRSLLDKMPGSYEEKFASLRVLYAYMAAHPGKKMLFMGGEIGQFAEWAFEKQIEFFLLSYPMHKKMQDYVKALNSFYLENPALYENDCSRDGFSWLSHDDYANRSIAFSRTAKSGELLIAVFNFSPVLHKDYKIGVPEEGTLSVLFNSDEERFGGLTSTGIFEVQTEKTKMHGRDFLIRLDLPPLSALYFQYKTEDKERGCHVSKEKLCGDAAGRGAGQPALCAD